MYLYSIVYFTIALTITWVIYIFLGKIYALDYPDDRKHHRFAIPQIGGLIFGPLSLIIAWWLDLTPSWYLVGGLVSILLGAIDDISHIRWQFKLFVQLFLAFYIAY